MHMVIREGQPPIRGARFRASCSRARAHSDHGDLTGLLAAYFDTTTGPKGEAESYRRIASALGATAGGGLFVSDVVAELDAARDGGLATALAIRTPPGPKANGHRRIASFDEL
jgi:enolase-phosphatase E1